MRSVQAMGDLLLRSGLIGPEQLEAALEEQKSSGEALEEAVLRLGLASEEELVKAVAGQLGLEYAVDPQRSLLVESRQSPEKVRFEVIQRDQPRVLPRRRQHFQ